MARASPTMPLSFTPSSLCFCLCFVVFFFSEASGNALVGELHYCEQEGSQVHVGTALLGLNSCFMCFCKNHMVQCNPSKCPLVEGCYRLKKAPERECCQSCLGCVNGSTEVPHGHSWREECRVKECQAGVLTASDMQCHVPCPNPVQPAEGECCPKCQGCWLEGHPIPEGAERSPRLDPCVKCACSGGRLTCTKRSCPVLSCPPNRAVLDTDGCCSVCNGSREMYVPPGGRCFLGVYLYQSGDNRTFDQCTTCTCHSGFLTCERQTCPPLQCPERYRQTEGGQCCPACVYPRRSQVCLTDGVLREHGDAWHLDRCSSCKCTHGRVTCQVDQCQFLNKECPIGFKKEESEENCCPTCVEEPGVCVTYGDPHYKTFDGYLFNFQGECRYELSKDCFGNKFSVRVNNDARRSSYFSWTRSLSLKIVIGTQKFKVSLGQRLRTKVNRKRVKIPFEQQGINITRKGYLITVDTPIGVEVNWDGASYVEVKASPSWRNRTCGLCGNFNRVPDDDRRSRWGEISATDEEMANSWQAGKAKSCSRRLRRLRHKEEEKEGAEEGEAHVIRTQRLTCLNSPHEAAARCSVLNHTVLQRCTQKVSPDSFYSSCLLDLCECPSSRLCECDALVAFVRECQRNHIDVSGWRTATKCGGFECPYGSMYMECAPACRPTCKNGTPNPNCHMRRCKPRCYCPPPTVLHRGACILPKDCPKKKRKSRKS